MAKGTEMSLNEIKRMLAKSNVFFLLATGDVLGLQQAFTPRYTTTQRDALTTAQKVAGLMIYNTTTNKLNFYNGTAWEVVTSA